MVGGKISNDPRREQVFSNWQISPTDLVVLREFELQLGGLFQSFESPF